MLAKKWAVGTLKQKDLESLWLVKNNPGQTEQSRFLKWLLKFEVKIVFNGDSWFSETVCFGKSLVSQKQS